jgi:hypothetical protein
MTAYEMLFDIQFSTPALDHASGWWAFPEAEIERDRQVALDEEEWASRLGHQCPDCGQHIVCVCGVCC